MSSLDPNQQQQPHDQSTQQNEEDDDDFVVVEGNNTLMLETEYKDKRGRVYLVKKEIIIELKRVTFFQKIAIVLKGVNRFIDNIFT